MFCASIFEAVGAYRRGNPQMHQWTPKVKDALKLKKLLPFCPVSCSQETKLCAALVVEEAKHGRSSSSLCVVEMGRC